MAGLSERDLERLRAFLEGAEPITSLPGFVAYVVGSLPSLVRCNAIAYSEIDVESRRAESVFEPAALLFEGAHEAFQAHVDQHPLVRRVRETGDGRAYRISDFLTEDEFHQLDLYQQFFCRIGAEDQIGFALPAPPPLVVGIALNRERRDFPERDRMLLNLARPYLALLHDRIQLHGWAAGMVDGLQRGDDRWGSAVILLGRRGEMEFRNAAAARLLDAYFSGAGGPATALPRELAHWVAGQRAVSARRFESPPPAEPLVRLREGKRLVVRYAPALRPNEREVLLLEETPEAALAASPLMELGLTEREGQIAVILASGMTNAEIGSALGISEKTVRTHLERIYEKLRVANRAAAVAFVYDAQHRQDEAEPAAGHALGPRAVLG
ncbi:MAG TPA: LuxR C-terminal-related transcriptional regulator [Dehalococcoidia bacterium]|nr:LuxR C-terminal-related transcriptional regulator [Dehalococcoidia bacterium]